MNDTPNFQPNNWTQSIVWNTVELRCGLLSPNHIAKAKEIGDQHGMQVSFRRPGIQSYLYMTVLAMSEVARQIFNQIHSFFSPFSSNLNPFVMPNVTTPNQLIFYLHNFDPKKMPPALLANAEHVLMKQITDVLPAALCVSKIRCVVINRITTRECSLRVLVQKAAVHTLDDSPIPTAAGHTSADSPIPTAAASNSPSLAPYSPFSGSLHLDLRWIWPASFVTTHYERCLNEGRYSFGQTFNTHWGTLQEIAIEPPPSDTGINVPLPFSYLLPSQPTTALFIFLKDLMPDLRYVRLTETDKYFNIYFSSRETGSLLNLQLDTIRNILQYRREIGVVRYHIKFVDGRGYIIFSTPKSQPSDCQSATQEPQLSYSLICGIAGTMQQLDHTNEKCVWGTLCAVKPISTAERFVTSLGHLKLNSDGENLYNFCTTTLSAKYDPYSSSERQLSFIVSQMQKHRLYTLTRGFCRTKLRHHITDIPNQHRLTFTFQASTS